MSKHQASKQAISDELRSLFGRAEKARIRYLAIQNPVDFDQALALFNQLIQHPTFTQTPKEFQAGVKWIATSIHPDPKQANPVELRSLYDMSKEAHTRYEATHKLADLDQALALFNQIIQHPTFAQTPKEFKAGVWGNMAVLLYCHFERMGDSSNLEQAILYSKQAHKVFTRQDNPELWAELMNNLGAAYKGRIHGDKAENLEQAILYYNQALKVFTRQANPELWAELMNNLGNAYQDRIRGDTAENLEKAIKYYKESLEVFTCHTHPREWAQVKMSLGIAYKNRISRYKAGNLKKAIKCYKKALDVFTHQDDPVNWARLMANLGNAYLEFIKIDKVSYLEKAIVYYNQALEVFTYEDHPMNWAKVKNNMGKVYLYLICGDIPKNKEMAIQCYQEALKVRKCQDNLIELAETMSNLGDAYRKRILGDIPKNEEMAIQCYQEALKSRTPTSMPQACRDTANNLCIILYELGRFSEARKYLEMAHEAIQNLRKEVKRHEGKQELSVENADLYAQLVACCLHDDPKDVEAAFTYAVAGKGRAFVDALASPRLTPGDAAKDNPELAADWATAQQLWQELENIRARLTRDSESGTGQELTQEVIAQLNQDLEQRQAKEREHWETMTFKYPALTATLQAPALSAADAKALASACQATLVEYYRHAEGWAAFVVTPTAIRYIPLEIPDELLEELQKWFDLIERVNNSKLKGTLVNRPEVLDTLSDLYKAIITPLGIEAGTSLIIAPFTQLHRFPLAAARNPDEQYLIDLYPLAFVPSLGALKVIKAQRERDQKQREARPSAPEPTLLSVAYPGEQGSKSYLDSAIPEAQAIMALFSQAKALHEAQATPNEVIKQAQAYDLLHFGCHGNFNSANPAQSGLLLADGKWLTVQQIITEMRLGQTALVTLGACESGLAAGNEGDELVGLVQGFLLAGPPAVVGSLWKVSDTSTKELFTTFYKALKDGKAPSQAMLEAVKWVRRESKWAHPYYWAAFQAYGLALGN